MTIHICPHEHAVIRAARTGDWTPALHAHADTCPDCLVTVRIASVFQRATQEISANLKPAVTYRALMIGAGFARKEEKLSKLDKLFLLGLLGVAFIVLAGAGIFEWGAVRTWFAGAVSGNGSHLPLYLLAGCAALIWFLTEEFFFADR